MHISSLFTFPIADRLTCLTHVREVWSLKSIQIPIKSRQHFLLEKERKGERENGRMRHFNWSRLWNEKCNRSWKGISV